GRRCEKATSSRDELLDLVVQHEHERAAGAADHVAPGALEEALHALLGGNLAPAVDGAIVLALATGLHHHAAAHRVERVRDDAGDRGHHLSDAPLGEEVGLLRVGKDRADGRVVQAKVGTAVHDDALHGHAKALVERQGATAPGDLADAVNKAV